MCYTLVLSWSHLPWIVVRRRCFAENHFSTKLRMTLTLVLMVLALPWIGVVVFGHLVAYHRLSREVDGSRPDGQKRAARFPSYGGGSVDLLGVAEALFLDSERSLSS